MNWLQLTISEQWNTSRNLHEGAYLKTRRLFWAAVYLVRIVLIGIRGMAKQQLGNRVKHQGEEWTVLNWAGNPTCTLLRNGERKEYVPQAEIKNIITARELWHRFNFMARWYATSWHGIDVNKRLYPAAFKREAKR